MKLKRITEVLTAVLFAAVLLFFCVFTLLRPKQAVSESERRKLKALPEFSTGSLLSGEYFSSFRTTRSITSRCVSRSAR